MRIVLCAYEAIGCAVLEHVLGRADVDEVAVYTHEPRPGVADVREVAEGAGIRWSTEDLSRAELPFVPDVVASVYYRNIIRPNVIELCGGRIFNVHPSLLPRHRGCSSTPWAIIEGDTVTGVTFHYIDEGVDTGPILLQAAVPIAPDETQATLYRRCMETGAAYFPAALELVRAGVPGVPQDGESCYHPRGAPYGGEIGEDWSPELVERFIRAMTFPPLPYATYRGREVRTPADYEAGRP